jgi:hypothetical protein
VEDLRAELKNAQMRKHEKRIKTNLMKRYEKCMKVTVMGI